MNSKVYEVLDKITDSDDTTVGGGCASALSGAMAAGMLSMVAKLSKKKPVNITEEQYDAIITELEPRRQQLLEGWVDAPEAYCMIVDAFKLPKGTDEEKAARRAAVEAAATRAAEVPLENGRLNARVYELGVQLRGNSNPACLSDLTSALYLAQGGVKDCVLNINANLGLIKKEETIASLKEAMLELLLQAICY